MTSTYCSRLDSYKVCICMCMLRWPTYVFHGNLAVFAAQNKRWKHLDLLFIANCVAQIPVWKVQFSQRPQLCKKVPLLLIWCLFWIPHCFSWVCKCYTFHTVSDWKLHHNFCVCKILHVLHKLFCLDLRNVSMPKKEEDIDPPHTCMGWSKF